MIVDVSQLPKAVVEGMNQIFRRRDDMDTVRARKEQAEVAALRRSIGQRAVDGLGPQRMAVHPLAYWSWVRARGRDCWDDPDFRKWYEKHPDNEDQRVKADRVKPGVGYTGGVVGARPERVKRWSKSYP